MIWTKHFKPYLILVQVLFLSCPSLSQNIALNKNYSLSELPNYEVTDKNNWKFPLTDGNHTAGLFWGSTSTLGWEGIKQVSIVIDLEQIRPIGSVTFNSARRQAAGVAFPANILVFLSNDNKSFYYSGDAMSGADNSPGEYAVTKFRLTAINRAARYVLVRVVAQQNSIFCDEIEVLKSNVSVVKIKDLNVRLDNLTKFVDSIQRLQQRRKRLLALVNQIEQSAETASINNKLTVNLISPEDLTIIENRINSNHVASIGKRYQTPLILESFNPWGRMRTVHNPASNNKSLNYQFLIPYLGSQYGGFVLTNATLRPLSVKFLLKAKNELTLYRAEEVANNKNETVVDALTPVGTQNTIAAGDTKLFVFKLKANYLGIDDPEVDIEFRGGHYKISISLRVLNQNWLTGSLNVNTWAYLNEPMLKNRQAAAILDLGSHYVNTISIPRVLVPVVGEPGFDNITKYLSKFKNVKNVLVEMSYNEARYRSTSPDVLFMSERWKSLFQNWYIRVIKSVKQSGNANAQVYLYPYDEVRAKDIERFKSFGKWLKSEVPNAKLYATLTSGEAIKQMIPLLDAVQVLDEPSLYDDLPDHKAEVWAYSTSGFSRNLDPYRHYRLMAWKAYEKNLTGIGFWNYSDAGDTMLNLRDRYPQRDYAVVYNAQNGDLISSRRWEAFSLGVEDYYIIRLYEKKFGRGSTLSKVENVIRSEDNIELADQARNEMLKSL